MNASAPEISSSLLEWYESHARRFAWRAAPGKPLPAEDPAWPYRVWLSEIMLQQTTTAAVAPYFEKFTAAWPDVKALAAADEAQVMAAWAGLGYYARARNLHACAREVAARGGHFPDNEGDLRTLPGLGAYTAAAVAAIAFGKRAVVVDANVERVVSRLFAIAEPLPGARKAIRQKTDEITPQERCGDFAQAMMDLGATVCTARAPRCTLCPLADSCRAGAMGKPERFPLKPPKRAKPMRRGTAFWIEREGQVWLARRPAKGMLGGMRALPDDGWHARADGSGDPPVDGPRNPCGLVKHVFTHFALELHLSVYSQPDCSSLDQTSGEWWPLDRLDEAGLPTLFAKAAQLALAQVREEEY